MNAVFQVDELTLHIISYLQKADLASLARTYKSLQNIALEVLWKELDGIIPLLLLLPPVARYIHTGTLRFVLVSIILIISRPSLNGLFDLTYLAPACR
jgi:hypothetical protein